VVHVLSRLVTTGGGPTAIRCDQGRSSPQKRSINGIQQSD
jgi:hypothetical protein